MEATHQPEDKSSAWHHFKRKLIAIRQVIRPPEPLRLSQWANKFAMLSKETSSQSGRFRSVRYQDGIMDAFTDPTVGEVIVMKSARVGYTKILDHVIGYYISHDPSPILAVQPRETDAEDYSKTEIAPMLRDTPVLAELVGGAKAKDTNQTILKRSFLNGSNLTLVGANSPGGFRRITCRIILFDEVDGYPATGAGNEGDQIALGKKRAETFWNSKIGIGSTPTVKGISRIEKAFNDSDQRFYYVPCPHCGEFQVLEWGDRTSHYGMKWERDENGQSLPETTYYACRHNACVIRHSDLPVMIERGEWRATKPFKGRAGFHIWTAYSLFPKAAWPKLVAEWLLVKDDPVMRQTFINTTLGLPYEDSGDKALNEKTLLERCEVYAAEVPDGVTLLTAGIDTQDNRLEAEIVGWGRNEESWSIDYEVFEGDLDTPEPWERLDAYLQQVWRRADGRGYSIMAACIDSGGHHTEAVYQFAKARIGRRIWAIKGESARGGKRSPVWPTKKPSTRSKSSYRPVIIGVNAAKDVIRNRLHMDAPAPGERQPGYMHYPHDRDLNYFSQLLAERSVKKTAGGFSYRVWELRAGRANEALDCRVYNYAALMGLTHQGLKLNKMADTIDANPDKLIAPPVVVVEPKPSFQLPGVIVQDVEPTTPPRKRFSRRLPS